ncbi:hypothetical protein WR25_05844 [Diploscapter pachys]|uniref:Protein amnionless n=1 Tax=Diploscapter pachys TaxID=2018661 RepID=A0A2A2L707_9BILA|nr:hypothetical protein WR25_05844 [Diploscapter pachys]
MTTQSTQKLFKTMEGQYQIELGPKLRKFDNSDDIEREVPTENFFTIYNRDLQNQNSGKGVFNYNARNRSLTAICQYVKCTDESTVDKEATDKTQISSSISGRCIKPLKPFGHCCRICGVIINFSAMELKISSVQDRVLKVLKQNEWLGIMKSNVERTDDIEDAIDARYQILLAHISQDFFDERIYKSATKKILEEMGHTGAKNGDHNNFYDVKIKVSRMDSSFRTSSIIYGSLTLIMLLILCIIHHFYRNRTDRERVRSWFWRVQPQSAFANYNVFWRHAGDEDIVELINPNHEETSSEPPVDEKKALPPPPQKKSEEQQTTREFANPAFQAFPDGEQLHDLEL